MISCNLENDISSQNQKYTFVVPKTVTTDKAAFQNFLEILYSDPLPPVSFLQAKTNFQEISRISAFFGFSLNHRFFVKDSEILMEQEKYEKLFDLSLKTERGNLVKTSKILVAGISDFFSTMLTSGLKES